MHRHLLLEHAHFTFCLTVGTVFVLILSQQFRQNGLMLLIQFLGFFSFGTRRHVCPRVDVSPLLWTAEKYDRENRLIIKRLCHAREAQPHWSVCTASIQPANQGNMDTEQQHPCCVHDHRIFHRLGWTSIRPPF